jgi:hypothetical protein
MATRRCSVDVEGRVHGRGGSRCRGRTRSGSGARGPARWSRWWSPWVHAQATEAGGAAWWTFTRMVTAVARLSGDRGAGADGRCGSKVRSGGRDFRGGEELFEPRARPRSGMPELLGLFRSLAAPGSTPTTTAQVLSRDAARRLAPPRRGWPPRPPRAYGFRVFPVTTTERPCVWPTLPRRPDTHFSRIYPIIIRLRPAPPAPLASAVPPAPAARPQRPHRPHRRHRAR